MTLQGYVDRCEGNFISGWAWDNSQPKTRLELEIMLDGKHLARVVARQYREDLKQAGIGDGAYAFEYTPHSELDVRSHKISVVVAGTHVRLARSQRAIPVPPDDMISLVVGHHDIAGFLASGAACLNYIKDSLTAVDFDLLKGKIRILDWDCGCGRITRHWEPMASAIDVFGCDLYEPAVRWCRDNIPFGDFSVCGTAPPLPYPDGYFDVIYGASVLTHLTFEMHYAWMREIWRLLTPGAVAVLTISGPSTLPPMLQRISQGDRADRAGMGVIVIDEEMFICIERDEGFNDTATVETHGAFARIFYPFNIKNFRPRYGLMGIQDTYVLTKKSEASLGFTESLFECEMDGTDFQADIPLELNGRRHFGVLASASNLFCPATIRAIIRAPELNSHAVGSPLVNLPEKVALTSLQAAYATVTVENIPDSNGTAILSIEVRATEQLDGARLHLRNAVVF